jgi:hypothetical protein
VTTGRPSAIYGALRSADASTPGALEVFDRVVAGRAPSPDLYEYSVRFDARLSPYRLTYYFDTDTRGSDAAREAGDRFLELVAELRLAVPSQLSDFLRSDVPAGEEVLQTVLGIDAAADGPTVRAKYYLVFRDDPGECVEELCRAAGFSPYPGADLARTYIVGVDVSNAGVDDVKLYFRLERSRLRQAVENVGEVGDLLGVSHDVVFQQCVRRPDRRQVYLHSRDTGFLRRWLGLHGMEEVLAQARRVDEALVGAHIDPWIVSFAYDRRRIDLTRSNVYFHLATGPRPPR